MKRVARLAHRIGTFALVALLALGAFALAGCTKHQSTSADSSQQTTAKLEIADISSFISNTPSSNGANSSDKSQESPSAGKVVESGTYTSKADVAAYIHQYGHLPSNYVSKTKARKLGWNSTEGNLQDACPGKCIGGGPFDDDDNQLPKAKGRTWTECDVNYHGGYRGDDRIVYSNDGLIYYTGDHYKTFERLY